MARKANPNDDRSKPRWTPVVMVLAASALGYGSVTTAAPPLEEVAKGVAIDANQISVSGISSGGFMAHQFHVAHSEHIMGVGIVAGGPYYCAQGSMLDAVGRCSQFVMLECRTLGLDTRWCGKTDRAPKTPADVARLASASFAEAKKQEAAGQISNLGGLQGDKVYLISAEYDAIVPHGVMDSVYRFYADSDKGSIEPGNITYNRTFPARHTMIRDSFAKPAGDVVGDCSLPPAPAPQGDQHSYIDDCQAVATQRQAKDGCVCPAPSAPSAKSATSCPPPGKETVCKDLRDVDLAGTILKRIYGEQALRAERVSIAESEVQAFDQRLVFAKFSDISYTALQQASMAREGYVFIPSSCREGRQCKLHVAFHGCRQGAETDRRSGHAGNLFAKFSGYNEWAKANDIVVLYPQIQARVGSTASPPVNPRGCWDWWGQYYTHEAYHTRGGKQIKAVAQMINILAGGRQLLPVSTR